METGSYLYRITLEHKVCGNVTVDAICNRTFTRQELADNLQVHIETIRMVVEYNWFQSKPKEPFRITKLFYARLNEIPNDTQHGIQEQSGTESERP